MLAITQKAAAAGQLKVLCVSFASAFAIKVT